MYKNKKGDGDCQIRKESNLLLTSAVTKFEYPQIVACFCFCSISPPRLFSSSNSNLPDYIENPYKLTIPAHYTCSRVPAWDTTCLRMGPSWYLPDVRCYMYIHTRLHTYICRYLGGTDSEETLINIAGGYVGMCATMYTPPLRK